MSGLLTSQRLTVPELNNGFSKIHDSYLYYHMLLQIENGYHNGTEAEKAIWDFERKNLHNKMWASLKAGNLILNSHVRTIP